jgi:hypothetical protein
LCRSCGLGEKHKKKKKLLATQVLLFAEFTDLRVAVFFAPLSEKLKGWFEVISLFECRRREASLPDAFFCWKLSQLFAGERKKEEELGWRLGY